MDYSSFVAGAAMGFLGALAANLTLDIVRARRNLTASARIVLDELDRLYDYFEDGGLKYDERRRTRLSLVLDTYREAIFAADPIAFESHLRIYAQMVPAVETMEEIEKREFHILVNIRKELRELVARRLPAWPPGGDC